MICDCGCTRGEQAKMTPGWSPHTAELLQPIVAGNIQVIQKTIKVVWSQQLPYWYPCGALGPLVWVNLKKWYTNESQQSFPSLILRHRGLICSWWSRHWIAWIQLVLILPTYHGFPCWIDNGKWPVSSGTLVHYSNKSCLGDMSIIDAYLKYIPWRPCILANG